MKQPDIEKLRRFSLGSGLVLITYFVAIVKPSSAVSFPFLGLTFNIMNPKYISIGFILASIYGLIRYSLYGMIIERSPSKTRKQLLSGKLVKDAYEINVQSKNDVDDVLKKLEYAFPSISKDGGGIEVNEFMAPLFKEQRVSISYRIRYKPTRRTNMLAICHDIDYTAPIWVNIVALMIATYRLIAA